MSNQIIKRQDILNDIAEFSWDFGNIFFVETYNYGNFIWSDPDYNGNNSFIQIDKTFEEYSGRHLFRDKGIHSIIGYCGDKIKIILLNGDVL